MTVKYEIYDIDEMGETTIKPTEVGVGVVRELELNPYFEVAVDFVKSKGIDEIDEERIIYLNDIFEGYFNRLTYEQQLVYSDKFIKRVGTSWKMPNEYVMRGLFVLVTSR